MASPEQVEAVRQVVEAQDAARTALTVQLAALAAQSARSFTGWYDTAAITAWAAELARTAEVLQVVLARQMDAYLARMSSVLGRPARPVGAVRVSDLRRGVTHAGAYARAADVYRYQQSRWDSASVGLLVPFSEPVARAGTSPDAPLLVTPELGPPTIVTPVEAAVQRAVAVAEADAQLVHAHQAQKFYERQRKLTGYRRVFHPELSTSGSCGLCIAASDRVYGPKELLPVHERCHCTTVPIYDRDDPGSTLNEGDLAKLYEHAGSTNAADLKRTRYRVDEHGELGPTLVPADAKPHSGRNGRRRERKPEPKTPEQEQETIRRVLAAQEAVLPRAEQLAREDPKRWGDYAAKLAARVADLRRQSR